MPLAAFGFLNMTVADVLDILLVAIIIYLVFRWIKGSSAMSLFLAVLSLLLLKVVVTALKMKMMMTLMDTLLDVGVIALIVIFQPEIRRFLVSLGNRYREVKWFNKFMGRVFDRDISRSSEMVEELSEAVRMMSEEKTGALIVLPHTNRLDDIVETGDKIDARVSRRLIMNIFFKNSPLHDGAMIISDGRIVAARCTLPMTQKANIPASFGMRHKAAIGVSEQTDAEVILVSEQTGHICYVKAGEFTIISNINELKQELLNGSRAENA